MTPVQNADAREQREPIDIHTWFGLTYANYLVLPRSVLQSMPEGWQHRFTGCLRELDEAFGHLDWPVYDVRALKRPAEFLISTPCEECEGEGWADADGEPCKGEDDGATRCESCDGEGYVEGEERYETAEEVGFRTDPIPHYNRGRTRLDPAEATR